MSRTRRRGREEGDERNPWRSCLLPEHESHFRILIRPATWPRTWTTIAIEKSFHGKDVSGPAVQSAPASHRFVPHMFMVMQLRRSSLRSGGSGISRTGVNRLPAFPPPPSAAILNAWDHSVTLRTRLEAPLPRLLFPVTCSEFLFMAWR